MTVVLETITTPDPGLLDMDIHLTANIQISAADAKKRVSVFVGNEIADLLYGEMPSLVLSEQGVYWRVPVVLAAPFIGRIAQVGEIDVDVETGKLLVTDALITEIEQHAHRAAVGAAL